MCRRVIRWAVGMACWVGLAAPAVAAVIHEEINAPSFFDGELPPELVAGGFDQIHGSIRGSDEGDLYRVYFPLDGELRLRGRVTSGPLDPTLFLFDSEGRGLFAIGTGGPLNQTFLDVAITAGTYYIGFGDYPLRAIDTAGETWDASTAPGGGPPSGFGVLQRLRNTGLIISGGTYRIDFLSMATGEEPSVPSVPEPSTLALLCGGLLVGGARLCRLRSRVRGTRYR
jgi:hypothetical protein